MNSIVYLILAVLALGLAMMSPVLGIIFGVLLLIGGTLKGNPNFRLIGLATLLLGGVLLAVYSPAKTSVSAGRSSGNSITLSH